MLVCTNLVLALVNLVSVQSTLQVNLPTRLFTVTASPFIVDTLSYGIGLVQLNLVITCKLSHFVQVACVPFTVVYIVFNITYVVYGIGGYLHNPNSRVIRDMCNLSVICARIRLYHHTLAGFIPIYLHNPTPTTQ